MLHKLARVTTREAQSLQERLTQATMAQSIMQSNAEFLVDGMNGAGWRSYGRALSAAFLIDRDGVIRLRQAWVNPAELGPAIDELLTLDSKRSAGQ